MFPLRGRQPTYKIPLVAYAIFARLSKKDSDLVYEGDEKIYN